MIVLTHYEDNSHCSSCWESSDEIWAMLITELGEKDIKAAFHDYCWQDKNCVTGGISWKSVLRYIQNHPLFKSTKTIFLEGEGNCCPDYEISEESTQLSTSFLRVDELSDLEELKVAYEEEQILAKQKQAEEEKKRKELKRLQDKEAQKLKLIKEKELYETLKAKYDKVYDKIHTETTSPRKPKIKKKISL